MIGARARTLIMVVVLSITAAACSGGGAVTSTPESTASAASPSLGDPATDKLAQVLDRGTLVLSTEVPYPPQSFMVEGAARAIGTRCASNQLTSPELAGYDIDTGKAVASALGVEPCWVTPSWTEVTGGNWGDRWDVAWGSGAINADRMTRLYMTQPYYSTPQRFFVRADSPYQVPSDLDGKVIGACASCTHEYYLKGELEVPGVDVTLKVKDPAIVTYQAERPGYDELAAGKIDAFLSAEPVGRQAIDEGLPLRPLDEAAFPLFHDGFVDRSSGLAQAAFVARVDEILRGLHADGTLKALSQQYFGVDYATAAGSFDLVSLGQVVQ
jgi:polar amino acid transport system substrate-binding protein